MTGRREFMRNAAALGTAAALGFERLAFGAEPPPETTRLRIAQVAYNCYAPQYVAEELLRGEGFADLQYVRLGGSESVYQALGKGEIDLSMAFSAPFVMQADAGEPVVMLGGMHPGCLELFVSSQIRSLRELKGRSIGIQSMRSAAHAFIATMVSHVGLDPRRDVRWTVVGRSDEGVKQFVAGEIDALMTAPPLTYALRARKVGHVLVNMTTDRPWSQYFCCVLAGNREFVRRHPIATKRAMRAILKGANLCANPEPAAKQLVSRGFHKDYDVTLQMLRDLPYARWRDYDAEDTVRYYALRLKEAGFIKSDPKKIIAEGTNWRFLNELKRELKA